MKLSRMLLVVAAAVAIDVTPLARDARQEVEEYLTRVGFAPADVAQLHAGSVITRAETGKGDAEIVTVAAVKIRVPRDQVISYYGQMVTYVDGQVTLAFGRFGSPPTPSDVEALSLDRNEVDDLRSCRAGKCDFRLGGTAIETLQSSVTWSGPAYVDEVNAFVRRAAVAYLADYQERGDAALVTYSDRSQPVSLKQQWQGILAQASVFHQYSPELKQYLQQYPTGSLEGARNLFYWVKENYGMKPVISFVHAVIYQPPDQSDRTIVAQKQIYASHYYDGSLALATVIGTIEGTAPVSYLLYANRSRGDLLKGGFGGLRRNVARDQARKAARETLGTIKRVLEQASGAR